MHSSSSRRFHRLSVALAFTLITGSFVFSGEPPEKKNKDQDVIVLVPFEVSTLGATPGGAKDIRFFRSGVALGQIPHPSVFTAEGLFSEHNLPLDLGETGNQLFRVQSAGTTARFEVLPDARYLAQLGLDSSIDAASWKRDPLNLVAVIDKSGSMSGAPLALVKASLKSALRYLRDGDQLSIVLYGDRSHAHLAPTLVERSTRSKIVEQIDAIKSAGSTNMEEGLSVGYRVARESKTHFSGNTRVMLFTDERPNVGNTQAGSFMAMAAAASQDGIGLTTIGVGVQFGAELATRISSVRGGNLFFFSSPEEMKKTFAQEFDTLVTELAHDFSIRIEPTPGLRIEGVFGVPGEMLRWEGRAIVLDVATIFLSRRKGAIYFALAPEKSGQGLPVPEVGVGGKLAEVKFAYRNAADLTRVTGEADCRVITPTPATAGLSRGVLLVDQYLTLKHAAQVHFFGNDQETAFRLVSGLQQRFAVARDNELEPERKLVRDLHDSFALLSGHAGEIQTGGRRNALSPLVGAWRASTASEGDTPDFIVVWPNAVMEVIVVTEDKKAVVTREVITFEGGLPSGNRGTLEVLAKGRRESGSINFKVIGNTLTFKSTSDNREAETTVFTRAGFSEIPNLRAGEEKPEKVDDLSGLPARTAVSSDARATRANLER